MAEKLSLESELQALSLRERLAKMGVETTARLKKNFAVQKIYPEGEVYPGWFAENAKRQQQQRGEWYSTGDAARTAYWQMRYFEGKDDFPSEVILEYFFNYYISFVDYGVGQNRPLSKVKRGAEAVRNQRYIDQWVPKEEKTHRPIFRKEMRLLKRRGGNWLTTWSGRLFMGYMFRGMEGITTYQHTGEQWGGFTFENLKIQTI